MKTQNIFLVLLTFLSTLVMAQNTNQPVSNCITTDVIFEEIHEIIDPIIPPVVDPPQEEETDPCEFPEREVFWLHGYQGDATSWINAQADIQDRFLVSSRNPDYKAYSQNLSEAASRVTDEYLLYSNVEGEHIERNFIIAHSMGGLVAREIGDVYKDGYKAYDGIVTFGTPHQGAAAANTLTYEINKIERFLNVTCDALSAGPLADETNQNVLVGTLASLFRNQIKDARKGVCEYLSDQGLAEVQMFVETGIEHQLTTDNAPNISQSTAGHNAAFYGIENDDNDDLAIRFAGTFIRNVNDFPLYAADDADLVGILKYTSALDFYVTKYHEWNDRHIPVYWYDALKPGIALIKIILNNNYKKVADDYKKGVDWFPTFNPSWKDLIGAGEITVSYEQVGCQCTTYSYGHIESEDFYYGNDIDCSQYEYNGNSGWTDCQPVYAYISLHSDKPSDAFILQESAAHFPGANYEAHEMLGSNHFQMRNDSNTARAMDAIFLDGLNSEYFKTCKR